MRPNGGAFEFTALGEGRFALAGVLDFHTAAAILKRSEELFVDPAPRLQLDLAAVEHADSAGLALLLECLSRAGRANKELCFPHLPEQILAIARISEVEGLVTEAQCR